ncbi:TrmH family RNA methyltransferase [Pseudalkalibacillus caeni]|uniref:RNA methyltransferase n=1 Tax=Exobacillus caeni TaxID=2574798 RepID=A0A5R9F6H5_9BACL|nr:RNA methyltransferase [Pseudalkalibacillus caeni]TLS39167.1 RNA methyltransferase [Pseudalkalibacillus caeni]
MHIESVKNSKVKEWKKLHTKRGRAKSGTFMIEGPHIVEEASRQGSLVKEVIMLEESDHSNMADAFNEKARVFTVTEKVMKEISDTETPQGIAAICTFPDETIKVQKGKFILLDSIQDPGNLGTIIRTADAAGYDAVILGDGCVDPYNSKVLRSTQGSIFHLPIVKANLEEFIKQLKEKQIPVYATEVNGGRSYTSLEKQDTFAIVMGNEANGVSKQVLQLADERIYIPIFGEAESLNVSIAAGILMYQLRAQH